MLFLTAILGAALGWFLSDFGEFGFIVGGFIGWLCGLGMRQVIRVEVKAATKALLLQFEGRSAVAPPLEVVTTKPPPIATVQRSEPAPQIKVEQPPKIDPIAWGQAAAPAEPSKSSEAMSSAVTAARTWLLGGNTIVRVGLVVLFVGLAFLANFAASAGYFPVEMRLALVAIVGAGLLIVGFRARLQRPQFGLAVQGGGVATIYLTLFAAARLIDGFSLIGAFALMIFVCALGCALALLQRSQALAATSFLGGFAVPLLLSTGSGDVMTLFVYYTLLNVAILVIAQRRSWRFINIIGFLATFGILILLVGVGLEPLQIFPAQVYLAASVLIYVATSVLYGRNTPSQVGGQFGNVVDTTLLFGTALVGFGLAISLVGDRPFGSAFVALAFAALYIAVAALVARQAPKTGRVMTEAMLAIGVVFVTLAIPLALGARWTSAAWALEGAGAFWIGMRQARWLPRLFGLALQGVAALVYLASFGPNVGSMPLANPAFMGAMLIALPVLATAFWLRHDLPHDGSRFAVMYARVEAVLGKPAFLFGFAFWWLAYVTETTRMVQPLMAGGDPTFVYGPNLQNLLAMLAFVVSAWGFQLLGRRTHWQVAKWPSDVSLAALVLGFLAGASLNAHILSWPAWLIWIIVIALHGRMLYLNDHDDKGAVARPLLVATHIGGVWLATAMLADCMGLALRSAALWHTSWAGVGLLACAVAVLLGLTLWATRVINVDASALKWPLDRYRVSYGWHAAVLVAALVGVGAFATAFFASGDAEPLPYIPLLNPVDLMVALAIATLMLWRRTVIAAQLTSKFADVIKGRGAIAALAILVFVAINTAWLRFAHQLLGVDWAASALFDSMIVQTGLAILWTVLALPLMVIAHRRADRGVWLAGAGLLGLTVAKLVLVDLTNTGGGARIIAFIAVGGLMLVVGYLAPLPPKGRDAEAVVTDGAAIKGTSL